ncbi:MAG: LacI family transcriptional regulator [Actinomycetia bacterium]|nr:LacI family transcriptional regulator [Actinomycetes bacterium]
MAGPDRRSITIEDVAAEAGVSVATVSRALRDLPNVAPQTRARVVETAERLRYQPDPSASRLATGRTTTIAIAVPLLDSWYFSKVMSGAEAVLADTGYDLLIFAVENDEARRRVLSGPLVKRVDGLILIDVHVPQEESADFGSAMGGDEVKVVCVGFSLPGASKVVVDDVGVARLAVSHLAELGHTRIALVGGPTDDPLGSEVPRARRQGYVDTMQALDLPLRSDYEAGGHFSVTGGEEAGGCLLDTDDPPTAVFAMSDEMAFGVLEAARERGLDVPGDLSVVGVDDHEVARVLGLTTIKQRVAEHGAMAARSLLEHLEDPKLPARIHRAETSLVVRRTTAPPAR